METLNFIMAEWDKLLAAPWEFLTAIVLAGGVGWKISTAWHRKEIDILHAAENLNNARMEVLKAEAENLTKQLAKLDAQQAKAVTSAPVMHGNAEVQSVFLEITQPNAKLTFSGDPGHLPPEQLAKYAAALRLEERGLANIEIYGTPPQQTIVTSSSAAFAVRKYIFDVAPGSLGLTGELAVVKKSTDPSSGSTG